MSSCHNILAGCCTASASWFVMYRVWQQIDQPGLPTMTRWVGAQDTRALQRNLQVQE